MNATPPTPPGADHPIPPYATTPAGPVALTPTPPIAGASTRRLRRTAGRVRQDRVPARTLPLQPDDAAGKTYKKAAVSLPAGTVVNGVDLSGRTAFPVYEQVQRAGHGGAPRGDQGLPRPRRLQIGLLGPAGPASPR